MVRQLSTSRYLKMICTRPKQFVPVQNNLGVPKLFWTYRRTRNFDFNLVDFADDGEEAGEESGEDKDDDGDNDGKL